MGDIRRRRPSGVPDNELMRTIRKKQAEANQSQRGKFEEKEAKLARAGYTRRRWGTHSRFPAELRYRAHGPCGLSVSDPFVHDPLCPANGNSRTTPLLSELR
ncbi:MAG TPA: hypothetical protein VF597_01790 [Candidatus Saccharimonadales bacterium]|jgi:hypothetical protein